MINDFINDGTRYSLEGGIYKIMDTDFEKKLRPFIDHIINAKSPDNLDPIADYEQLPFIKAKKHKIDWRLRQEDVTNIRKLIGNKSKQTILEVGPFNSWLSHHIQKMGHRLVCVDYFDDDTYGLKSKFHYQDHDWVSIQCNLEELTFFRPCFDMIIFNHGIHFFSNVEKTVTQLKGLLKPGGIMMILGLFIFKDDKIKKRKVAEYKKEFYNKTGFDMFMYPSVKGYLDNDDMRVLGQEKILFKKYMCCMRQNTIACFVRTKQLYYYGIYSST